MKRHKFLALALIGALGLGLVGCGGGGEEAASVTAETSAEPVHITTTESWDFSSGFYPAVAPGSTGSGYGFVYYIRNCYDTLVTRDAEGNYQPALAESWNISEDGLTYTFHLREGVTFSDGAALDAEAVKTSIEAAFANMGEAIGSFGKIGTLTESIEAVDDLTVALHLTSPYYGVLNDLAMANPMAIVSPNAVAEDLSPVEATASQTFGSGPYIYKGDGDGTSYTFVRNPNYWSEPPDVDSFTVNVIADPEAAVLALSNGEVDLIAGSSRLSFAGYGELVGREGIGTMIDEQVSNSRFLAFNPEAAPFDDAAVRQAAAFALDSDAIAETVFAGLESASAQVLDENLPYCNALTTTYSYDPDKAAELLESAGWTDSDGDGVREKNGETLSVTLDYITNQGTMDDAALAVAEQLGAVGFDVTPRGADNMTWFTTVAGDYDFTMHSTYGGYYDPFLTMTNMNPETMGDPVLSKVALAMDGGTDLIKELDSTASTERVQEIYDEVLTFATDEAILVPFTSAHQYAAWNSEKIGDFHFGTDPLFIEIANVTVAA